MLLKSFFNTSLVVVILFACLATVSGESRRRKAKLSFADRKEIRLQQNRVVTNEDNDETENQVLASNEDDVQDEDNDVIYDCHLAGLWYNQHGSELFINQSDTGKLSGEFRTGVAMDTGIVGTGYAELSGTVCGSIFSFHVVYPQTHSIASWTGQCHKPCDLGYIHSAATMLTTSWTLTTQADTCNEYWKSNRMGQDFFTRRPLKSGPRKGKSTASSDNRQA